jgi:PAS domain S-box-containing protein
MVVIPMADIKILLVEDESIEAMDIKRTLESFGYEVPYVASRGEEAVDKALEILPDIILMDIILKGDSDGIEAVSRIKELNIPVIYLTAHSEESTIERAKLTEPYGYIIKPYDSTELKYAIDLAVYKNQMEKERKKVEDELLHSNEWLGYVQRAAKSGFWDWDMITDKITWAPELFELFGLPKTYEPSFDIWLDIIHPDDRDPAMDNINRAIEEHKFLENEYRIIPPNGKEIWIAAIGSTVYDEDGQPTRMSGICLDITERKKSEKDLIDSEGLLRGLFDNMPSGMAVYHVQNDGSEGSDYIIKEFNRTSQEIEGMKREEVIGKSLYDIRPNIDEYGLIPIFKKVWETGEPIHYPSKIYVDEKYANWYENYVFKAPTGELVALYNDVTEQEKANEALKKSEEKFRTVSDYNYDWEYWISPDGDLLYVSPSCERITGYISDEFIKEPTLLGKISHPDDIEIREHLQNESKGQKRLDVIEYRIITKQGEQRWIAHGCQPVYNKEGEFIGRRASNRDITKRKKAETERLESQEFLENIVENIPNMIFVKNADNLNFELVNKAGEELLGHSREELLGKSDFDFFPKEEAEFFTQKDREVLQNKELLDIPEETIQTKNLGKRIVHTKKIPILNKEGNPQYLLGISEDITELKKAATALIKSENRFRNLLEEMKDGVTLTHHGVITYVNPFMANMLSFKSSEELIGKNVLDFMTPQSKEEVLIEINKIQAKSDDVRPSLEIDFRCNDGTQVTTETITSSMELDGKIYGIGIYKDITDKIRVQKALEKSETRYRTLYSSMNEGLALHEVLYDDNNIPVDYEIIDVNPAYEEILGIKRKEVVEKKASEVYGTGKPPYLKFYSKVAQTGKPHYFETYFEPMDKYFRISVFSPSKGTFATIFEDITERKKAETSLKESEERFRMLFELNNAIMLLIEPDSGNIIDANPAAGKFYGYPLETLRAMNIGQINQLPPEEIAQALKQAQKEDEKYFIFPHKLADGEIRAVEVFSSPIIFEEENILFSIINDITSRKHTEEEIKKSLTEKENLLREIHHRVKNNMQIIASLINLQLQEAHEEETVNVLKESQGRVKTMAMVHEKLYHSPTFTNINVKEYVDKLVYEILYSYKIQKGIINIELDVEDIKINMETAIPLGLIINELVTNSVKHAFPQSKGTITIKLKSTPDQMELKVADDGIGIPKDIDIENTKTLGLQLLISLVKQLDGNIEMDRGHGTEFKITFKELQYKERL